MQFEHYLITRYNLGFKNWTRDKNGKEIRTQYWLQEREILFNTFCVPSVLNQSTQNFKWIILTDKHGPQFNFPEPIIELRIEGLNWVETLQKWIKANTQSEFLITTRLDNDDAIYKSLLGDVQNKFEKQPFQFVNPYNGYLLYNHKLYKTQHPSNQFISLIESARDPKTVYYLMHGEARTTGKILQISGKRYWIRVVHGRNIVRDKIDSKTFCGTVKPNGFGVWDT